LLRKLALGYRGVRLDFPQDFEVGFVLTLVQCVSELFVRRVA
jgi:hypothetical protein